VRAHVRLGLRPWDHLTPLALGEVRASDFDLDLARLEATPDITTTPQFDGGETSFSRYVLGLARGDRRLVGLPAFVMRGFRHRCLIVRRASRLEDPAQLGGRRIGLTGWPDSGNTWTRAVLRHAGVDLSSIDWLVGPAFSGEVAHDAAGLDLPPNVRTARAGETLVGGLLDGTLDVAMMPFMPPELHQPDGPLRPLIRDYRAAEIAYFRDVGFVPGIHVVTLKREVVDASPWLPAAVVELLDRSKRRWWTQRKRLFDTTPWLLQDIDTTIKTIGDDWMPYGVAANARMVAAFCTELEAQGIAPRRVDPGAVFADYARLSGATLEVHP
jgi:4,5-dihydroxyphthalate decarboxylase